MYIGLGQPRATTTAPEKLSIQATQIQRCRASFKTFTNLVPCQHGPLVSTVLTSTTGQPDGDAPPSVPLRLPDYLNTALHSLRHRHTSPPLLDHRSGRPLNFKARPESVVSLEFRSNVCLVLFHCLRAMKGQTHGQGRGQGQGQAHEQAGRREWAALGQGQWQGQPELLFGGVGGVGGVVSKPPSPPPPRWY